MSVESVTAPAIRKPKDYASDQEVRWCPGCGDYAVLKAVQKTLAELQADPDQTVFVSGIGCAARFPYYLNCYGFHTIHGRAAAIATGVKLARPELDVWVASGDGDSLSIGGNHLIHLLRRNVDLQYLLFNNEIYGLTKGQYSPASRTGTRSPSSPSGSAERPLRAARLALGAGARFIARAIDVDQPGLTSVLKRAREHRGTSLVEILQNCIVYNDGIYDPLVNKKSASEHRLVLKHGEPMLYGAERDRGLRLNLQTLRLETVQLGNGIGEDDLLIHDETNPTLAALLADLDGPNYPTPLGVLFCEAAPCLSAPAATLPSLNDLDALLRTGPTWTVSE